MYLLDFKEGVEFQVYLDTSLRHPAWSARK